MIKTHPRTVDEKTVPTKYYRRGVAGGIHRTTHISPIPAFRNDTRQCQGTRGFLDRNIGHQPLSRGSSACKSLRSRTIDQDQPCPATGNGAVIDTDISLRVYRGCAQDGSIYKDIGGTSG